MALDANRLLLIALLAGAAAIEGGGALSPDVSTAPTTLPTAGVRYRIQLVGRSNCPDQSFLASPQCPLGPPSGRTGGFSPAERVHLSTGDPQDPAVWWTVDSLPTSAGAALVKADGSSAVAFTLKSVASSSCPPYLAATIQCPTSSVDMSTAVTSAALFAAERVQGTTQFYLYSPSRRSLARCATCYLGAANTACNVAPTVAFFFKPPAATSASKAGRALLVTPVTAQLAWQLYPLCKVKGASCNPISGVRCCTDAAAALSLKCVLSSPAPNTAKVCARRPTPPASRLISAIKGAVGDAQSVAVTLPLASDNGGSTAGLIYNARLAPIGGGGQALTLASSIQRVLSFKEGAASVPAKGLCGKKWRVSGQWCNAAGCSDWVDAAQPVEMEPCCADPGATCSASLPCCTAAGVVKCVHRTDSLTSALVCAQPPTAPVSGPSTAITAVAGKSGDTQYIVVKLLPASDNGGTTAQTGYMVRLTKISSGTREAIELPRANQRSFAFIEGKTAGVAVKGLCGKTWRAAAQWCNTVGCSGWLEDDQTLAMSPCCADLGKQCSTADTPCCAATPPTKCVLSAPEPNAATVCARPPAPTGTNLKVSAAAHANVWSVQVDLQLLGASANGGTTSKQSYNARLLEVGTTRTLQSLGNTKQSFAFVEGSGGIAAKSLCGKTWRASGQWCNAAGCSPWVDATRNLALSACCAELAEACSDALPCCAGTDATPNLKCVPSAANSPKVCARPPTPPGGDAIKSSSSAEGPYHRITVALQPAGDTGGTTYGASYGVRLEQDGLPSNVLPLSSSGQTFTFKEGTPSIPANALCGKTWHLKAQWCNAAGCSEWVEDDAALAMPSCVPPDAICWGEGSYVPPTLWGVKALSKGGHPTVALMDDGTIRCWASYNLDIWNVCGVPAGLSGVVQVAAGFRYSCALKGDGTVTCWGDCSYGQCVPAGLSSVLQVAAGTQNSCALKVDHTVQCWGTDWLTAVDPAGSKDFSSVTVGYGHACALRSDGTVACAGVNHVGQSSVPPGLADVVQVSAGESFTCALKKDGTVTCWGDNTFGQLDVPSGLLGATQISTGTQHACVLKLDGSVTCWGDNTWGQTTVPDKLPPVRQVSAGGNTCVLVAN